MESPKTLTSEDAEKLLHELLWQYRTQTPAPKGIRNHAIALLMLDAGLRVGEVVQLRGFDLYFNCAPVTAMTVRAEIAKNKTERAIPLSQRLIEALKKHAAIGRGFTNLFSDVYVFSHEDRGKPLTTRQVERIIRNAAMKSLGRPIHPHVLRHTFASRLMRKTNIRVVQELLGHKHLTSTQVYTHPNGDDLREAINGIDIITCHGHRGAIRTNLSASVPNQLDAAGTDRDVR